MIHLQIRDRKRQQTAFRFLLAAAVLLYCCSLRRDHSRVTVCLQSIKTVGAAYQRCSSKHTCITALVLDRNARAYIVKEETVSKRLRELHSGRQTSAVRDADALNVERFKSFDGRLKLLFRRLH